MTAPVRRLCPSTYRPVLSKPQAILLLHQARHHAPTVPRRISPCGTCQGWHVIPAKRWSHHP